MSRRSQITMTDEEIGSYLRSARTMTLVSNGKGGFPHPMPMWFAIDDDNNISMTTFRKSQKINNLRRDPKVALLVESGDAYEGLLALESWERAIEIDPEFSRALARLSFFWFIQSSSNQLRAGITDIPREDMLQRRDDLSCSE